MASALSVRALSLRYGARRVLDGLSFDVAPGSVFALLGPSGSGKSSALRLVAGLERPEAGTIVVDGETLSAADVFVAPERRRVGMVFQDFALFPHLTVRENVAFGLRGRPAGEAAREVARMLAAVHLGDRGESYPHMLSGGERQRVALARALAPRPRLLLMDEPFSSLDSRLRDEIRDDTLALLRADGVTTIIVTHDPAEALRVADRIGVLAHGRLAQCGTPDEIYEQPCSPQMACTFGVVNTLRAAVDGGALHTPLGAFRAPSTAPAGDAVVCIRPHHLSLCRSGPGVRGRVTAITRVGELTEIRIALDGTDLVARVPGASPFAVGDDPHVVVDPSRLLVFPQPDSGAPALIRSEMYT